MQIVINMRHANRKNVSRDFRDLKRRKFPTKITLKGLHNHAVTNADALRELRVNPEIKAMFDTYFELGEFKIYMQLLKTRNWTREITTRVIIAFQLPLGNLSFPSILINE